MQIPLVHDDGPADGAQMHWSAHDQDRLGACDRRHFRIQHKRGLGAPMSTMWGRNRGQVV
ncbi:MAG: hypothetical protein WCQ91_07885 [Planctomycetota bacterium]